jgi:AcrR family transcriptional regulator
VNLRQPAAKRGANRTRERILAAGLTLFNERGVPHVTTNHIADAAGISPGNLYYHFRHKEDIVMALFERYLNAVAQVTGDAAGYEQAVDDLWLLVHLSFEVIQDYQFIHRDLSELCSAYPALRRRFLRGLESGVSRMSAYCRALAATGSLDATPEEARALATNIALVMTYWLNLRTLQRPAGGGSAVVDDDVLSQGVFQVMSLVTPYLRGEKQAEFRRVARRYLPQGAGHG